MSSNEYKIYRAGTYKFQSLMAHLVTATIFYYSLSFISINNATKVVHQTNTQTPLLQEIISQNLYDMNPEYILAVAVLESDNRRGWMYQHSHNLFSIKSSLTDSTTLWYNGARYKIYETDEESIRDFARLVHMRMRYAHAYRAAITDDRRGFFICLQRDGYADDKNYAKKLERTFQDFQREKIAKRFSQP